MTRQDSSRDPSKDAAQQRSQLLRPLGSPRSLSAEVVDRLAEQIISGKLPAGAKLPSEQEMMRGMGVSRTVVREAVAALRARGLVITRQGDGAFVDRDLYIGRGLRHDTTASHAQSVRPEKSGCPAMSCP